MNTYESSDDESRRPYVGKTSHVFRTARLAMQQGVPLVYFECEVKMTPDTNNLLKNMSKRRFYTSC